VQGVFLDLLPAACLLFFVVLHLFSEIFILDGFWLGVFHPFSGIFWLDVAYLGVSAWSLHRIRWFSLLDVA